MTNYTIQDIFKRYGLEYTKNHKLSKEQWKVFNAILNCKTSALGIHTTTCHKCGEVFSSFNSCRNRHCPMCQNYAREKWIEKESNYLLNCPYFHVVTTIPYELNEIILYNQEKCYQILFKSTSESILQLCNDPKWLGAKVGITSILHTWGQTLDFHPHIHSIVTGGGIKNNCWIQSDNNYLIKVQVFSSLFKGKFLSKLKRLELKFPDHLKYLVDNKKFNDFLSPLYEKKWVEFIEPPKGSPENVVEYIGRYSFRVAISNERIKDISDGKITFEYKDYKDNSKIKEMTISAEEFIRRFLLHVLPHKFTKIRHYGLLANRSKTNKIKFARMLIGQKIFSDFTSSLKRKVKKLVCPKCGSNSLTFNYIYSFP